MRLPEVEEVRVAYSCKEPIAGDQQLHCSALSERREGNIIQKTTATDIRMQDVQVYTSRFCSWWRVYYTS